MPEDDSGAYFLRVPVIGYRYPIEIWDDWTIGKHQCLSSPHSGQQDEPDEVDSIEGQDMSMRDMHSAFKNPITFRHPVFPSMVLGDDNHHEVAWLAHVQHPSEGWKVPAQADALDGGMFDLWAHTNKHRGINVRLYSEYGDSGAPVILSDGITILVHSMRASHHSSNPPTFHPADEVDTSGDPHYIAEAEYYCHGEIDLSTKKVKSLPSVVVDKAIVTRQTSTDHLGRATMTFQNIGEASINFPLEAFVQEQSTWVSGFDLSGPVNTALAMPAGEFALREEEEGIHTVNIIRTGYPMSSKPTVALIEHLVVDERTEADFREEVEEGLRLGRMPLGDWRFT